MGSRSGILFAALVPIWLVFGQQPIEFPHNKHVAIGMECVDCHITVDTAARAGLPSVRKCMLCHRTLGGDAPGVKEVRRYAKENREIPWARIYRFEQEAHVKFQHAPHIWAGVECKTCHGDVEKMTVARPVVKHNMGTCLSCHRQRNASQDCASCHF